MSLAILSSSNTTYNYVPDNSLKSIYILNDDCSYISYKNFSFPAYMVTVGDSLYISGDVNIWKADKDLKVSIQYNSTGSVQPGFRGIY